MEVRVEKRVELARGSAEIDVTATEMHRGRSSTIFCECKHWKASVPQHVVHSFRSIVADSGVNKGYLISSSSFQQGAIAAAALTNVSLLTWDQFQNEFEATWLERYLRPEVTNRLDNFMTLVEPLPPRRLETLAVADRRDFLELRDRYMALGILIMQFSIYSQVLGRGVPDLPLRRTIIDAATFDGLSEELLDATGYREFLDILTKTCVPIEKELEAILSRE
jgi:restriction system protein